MGRFARRVRLVMVRLPKNLRSNRWWVMWNGSVYFAVANPERKGRKFALASVDSNPLEKLPKYVRFKNFLPPRKSVSPLKTGVLVQELGMFGNMTRRLSVALFVAARFELGHVVVPREVEFFTGLFKRGIHKFDSGYQVWFSAMTPAKKNPIEALHTLSTLDTARNSTTADPAHSEDAWANVRAMLVATPAGPPFESGHLVIHLRGGDVFGPRKPRSYGQPPLSYYLLVLDDRPWTEVTIVFQDETNPVLAGIVKRCEEKGITMTLQSSTLDEDLPVLLRARTLVAGRGTFIPAVVGLSECASAVYFFEDKFSLDPGKKGVLIRKVLDKDKEYVRRVLSDNWSNSPEQRALMLEYPVSSLVIES